MQQQLTQLYMTGFYHNKAHNEYWHRHSKWNCESLWWYNSSNGWWVLKSQACWLFPRLKKELQSVWTKGVLKTTVQIVCRANNQDLLDVLCIQHNLKLNSCEKLIVGSQSETQIGSTTDLTKEDQRSHNLPAFLRRPQAFPYQSHRYSFITNGMSESSDVCYGSRLLQPGYGGTSSMGDTGLRLLCKRRIVVDCSVWQT